MFGRKRKKEYSIVIRRTSTDETRFYDLETKLIRPLTEKEQKIIVEDLNKSKQQFIQIGNHVVKIKDIVNIQFKES